ncbi:MAG: sel1 repeat family protein [Alphaproteobacteria bacterium]|nr:sel1 repeat family protein [Alphaproteobacteria bacterium]
MRRPSVDLLGSLLSRTAMLAAGLGLLAAPAVAEELPGLPLSFDVGADGGWRLGADLPPAFVAAGAQPGWILTAVDGVGFSDPKAAQRRVASGPAREVQLRFRLPPPPDQPPAAPDAEPTVPDTILVVERAPLVHVEQLGVLPWPDGFVVPDAAAWQETLTAAPALVDGEGRTWVFDSVTGALQPREGAELSRRKVPDVFWHLADAEWVVDRSSGIEGGDREWAQQGLAAATRLDRFQAEAGDHLVQPRSDGLEVLRVEFPRGTPLLPTCNPVVPETCLAGGTRILDELMPRPGARDEAWRQLGLACAGGVHRACYEAVALEDERLAPQADQCVDGDVGACNAVAERRLKRAKDKPDDLVIGLLEYACELEGSGSLGERLRRIEDVGAGCMMLADAYDTLEMPDQALLNIDRACVVGRADACEEAADRRHQAFAARTVRECEDTEHPVAASCVELGRLLSVEEVAAASLDDFGSFLRACELGANDGCIELGDFVDRWGIENQRVIDAEKQLRSACLDGEQRACLGAAHLLVRHEPRTEAYREALVLFTEACEAGLSDACVAGAEQRRIGYAKKTEAPPQDDMWAMACDLHSADGCAGLGDRLSRSKQTWPGAFDAWTRSCDLGQAPSCTDLGLLVERKHDPWTGEQPRDSYLTTACDNGDAEGCYWLAEDDLPRRGEPSEDAYLLLDRSCEGEYGPGCAELADVHLDRKTSFDDEIAARHLDTACSNSHFDSCRTLGVMFMRGKGVERDRQRANELLEKFRLNAPRKHVRLGLHAGLPTGAGGELELVLPIPVGPAISVGGTYSYMPWSGSVMALLVGQDSPSTPPDLQSISLIARLYPNTQARGLYGAVAVHQIDALGGSLTEDLQRQGLSGRVGYRTDRKSIYTSLEIGFGQYGFVDLNDFDEDEEGLIPLVMPALAFSVGVAFL